MLYPITPVPKPRMTGSDKWKKRPNVMKYWAFKEECRLRKVEIPEDGCHIIFTISMPKSWSKKKKLEMAGKPHQQTPDLDNICKAIFDAIYDNDSHIWTYRATKIWGTEGSIRIIPDDFTKRTLASKMG